MLGINLKPSPRQLRQFAAMFFVFFAAGGYWALRKWGSPPVSAGVWTAAVVVGVLGLARPSLIRPVYLALTFLTLPIGWVVSFVLLAVAYFLVITPIGLLMRLLGKDPLSRRFDKSAKTYWVERPAAAGVDSYFRQF